MWWVFKPEKSGTEAVVFFFDSVYLCSSGTRNFSTLDSNRRSLWGQVGETSCHNMFVAIRR